nr:hypothetical protein [uncultured Dysosmobacter sp.]
MIKLTRSSSHKFLFYFMESRRRCQGCFSFRRVCGILPSVDKGQHGFSGHLGQLAALSSLPGASLGPAERASADLAV